MSQNEFSPAIKLYDLLFIEYNERESYQMGKVLTIIDASIADPEQRKGIKDLIRQAYYNEKDWFWEKSRGIISQFCQKYAKFDISEKERIFLEIGNWPNVESIPHPVASDYFADN